MGKHNSEYLDLYDENKNKTGEVILRSKGKPNVPIGRFINIVIIFIENNKGEFLIQKTSKQKNSEWATTGGHVKSGKTCDETIVEEVKEELGIDIKNENYKLMEIQTLGFVYFNVYYLKKDIDIKDIIVQEEEVEFVKWLSVDEIKDLIDKEEFRKSNVKAFLNLIN